MDVVSLVVEVVDVLAEAIGIQEVVVDGIQGEEETVVVMVLLLRGIIPCPMLMVGLK
jgi:hypothetical protein